MQIPVALERLVFEFSRFPGVGRKTAQRLAFNILRYTTEETQNLTDALTTGQRANSLLLCLFRFHRY